MRPLRLLPFSIAVLPLLLAAQSIRWISDQYDFGCWNEAQGPRTGRAYFVNEGSRPTFIKRVRPSCGCTDADFFKEIILPGDTAWVSFTYNPVGRPGQFEKTVKVYTGEESSLSTVTIRGTIIGAPETMEIEYPVEVGPARLNTTGLEMGRVAHGHLRHDFFKAYNQTGDTLHPMAADVPEQLKITLPPAVEPGRYFSIGVCYDGAKEHEPGNHRYDFTFIPDVADASSSRRITVSATALSPSEGLSAEQLAAAPSIDISPSVIEIKGKPGKQRKFRIRIANTGHSDLTIRRIELQEGNFMEITRRPVRIRPGKATDVEGVINLKKIPREPFSFPVIIHSNDPVRPEVTVRIAGANR